MDFAEAQTAHTLSRDAWSLPVTWQRWPSHHSIRRNLKRHAACKLRGSMFYRSGVIADRSFTLCE